MGNRKTKLASLKMAERRYKRRIAREKKTAEEKAKALPQKIEQDNERRLRHAAHLQACAAKTIRKLNEIMHPGSGDPFETTEEKPEDTAPSNEVIQ